MASRFDSIQKSMVGKVNNLYAQLTIWNPSDLSLPQTGYILFKDPTRDMELSGIVDYDPLNIFMEYHITDFIGLKEASDKRLDETLIVDGVPYFVRNVRQKYDGRTMIAIGQKV